MSVGVEALAAGPGAVRGRAGYRSGLKSVVYQAGPGGPGTSLFLFIGSRSYEGQRAEVPVFVRISEKHTLLPGPTDRAGSSVFLTRSEPRPTRTAQVEACFDPDRPANTSTGTAEAFGN